MIRPPAIVTPVSRLLAVADLPRSLAFYRDVLGFEAADAEARSGPARIGLSENSSAPDSTGEARPRGSAMVFFETDDLTAMREAIRDRGGAPSEIEKFNGIKMRVFQVRDPEGHTLWFGQSFQEPEPTRPPPMLRKALPSLPLSDVAAGIAHYRDLLGFSVNYTQPDLGVMDRDEITLLLAARTEGSIGAGACYLYVRDADALYAELVSKGAKVLGQPISQPWGLREFQVRDLEGNQLTFGQPFE